MTPKVDDSVIAAGLVFKEDGRLRAEYRYKGVLIDEQRILRLEVCTRIHPSSCFPFVWLFLNQRVAEAPHPSQDTCTVSGA